MESTKNFKFDDTELALGNTFNSAETDPTNEPLDVWSIIDKLITNFLTPAVSPIAPTEYFSSNSTESIFDSCRYNNQDSDKTDPKGIVNNSLQCSSGDLTSISTIAAVDLRSFSINDSDEPISYALTPCATPTSLAEQFVENCREFPIDSCDESVNNSFCSNFSNSTAISFGGPLDLRTYSINSGYGSISNDSPAFLSDFQLDLPSLDRNCSVVSISNNLTLSKGKSLFDSYYNNNRNSTPHNPTDSVQVSLERIYKAIEKMEQHTLKKHKPRHSSNKHNSSRQYNNARPECHLPTILEQNNSIEYNGAPPSPASLEHQQNQQQSHDPHSNQIPSKRKLQGTSKKSKRYRQCKDAFPSPISLQHNQLQQQHYDPLKDQLSTENPQTQVTSKEHTSSKQFPDAVIGTGDQIPSVSPMAPKAHFPNNRMEFFIAACLHNNNQASAKTDPKGIVNNSLQCSTGDLASISSIAAVNLHSIRLNDSDGPISFALTPSATPTPPTEQFVTSRGKSFFDSYNGIVNRSSYSNVSDSTLISSDGPLDLRTCNANRSYGAISNHSPAISPDGPLDLRSTNTNRLVGSISNSTSHKSHQHNQSNSANLLSKDIYDANERKYYRIPTDYNVAPPPSAGLQHHPNHDPHTNQLPSKHKTQEKPKSSRQSNDPLPPSSNLQYDQNQQQHHTDQLSTKNPQPQNTLKEHKSSTQLTESVSGTGDQIFDEIGAATNLKKKSPCTSNQIPEKDDRVDRFNSAPRRKKPTFTNTQVAELERYFSQNRSLTPETLIGISEKLSVGKIQVKKWFMNRRCREQTKPPLLTEPSPELLEQCWTSVINYHMRNNYPPTLQLLQQHIATHSPHVPLNLPYSAANTQNYSLIPQPVSENGIASSYNMSMATPLTNNAAAALLHPTSVHPTTMKPTIVQPITMLPTTVLPTTVQPTTVQPRIVSANPRVSNKISGKNSAPSNNAAK